MCAVKAKNKPPELGRTERLHRHRLLKKQLLAHLQHGTDHSDPSPPRFSTHGLPDDVDDAPDGTRKRRLKRREVDLIGTVTHACGMVDGTQMPA